MSLGHGASIVRDGLVLHLDTANVKSYSGSGTAWTDLSGNGNNGTLVNGPLYNSNNNGYLDFDGVNDYGEIPRSDLFDFGSGNLTIDFWIYMDSYTGEGNITVSKTQSNGSAGQAVGGYINSSGLLGLYASDNVAYRVSATGGTITLNRWHHISFTRVGSTWTSYLNTEVVATATWSGTVSHVISGNYGSFAIGAYNSAYGGDAGRYPTNGRFSDVKIYKGVGLASDQIKQNFNALRGRYGI